MAALALKVDKKVLRKAVRAKLRELSLPRLHDQSQVLTTRLLSLPSFIQSKSIGCYLNMPSGEVDTSLLVREILHAGKTLFVPKIDTAVDGRMQLLQIYDEDDLNSLPSGVWGIKEPDALRNGQLRTSASDAGLDMILCPGLAFDRSFSRLGHGKGYYDRFLTAYTEGGRPPPLLVGLALREQLLDSDTIPIDEHDWKMNCIVTDQGSIQQ
ncbi:hypothetical protein B0H16DRAFT_1502151 [Mycena metata]|uniref:5-formyltetrahydrofolate cyclo-ligase n=1 Tax=Mycena metata TaxID=1033252 RepID=A0AAD7K6C9_9AGAR|nr:hypothetical protein B0H16DRAFT_1502151 [Mycena metata]